MKEKKAKTNKKIKLQGINEGVLFSTLPAKRRLIFRWCESIIIVLFLLTFWLLLAKDVNLTIILVVSLFLLAFVGLGLAMSLLLRKNTIFIFAENSIIVRSGITEIIESRLAYNDIVLYKKIIGLPDILTKRETATFKLYKIEEKKNGKKVFVQDQVCSMYGVKKHREISNLFNSKNIAEQKSRKDKTVIKKRLREEWKLLKAERKNKIKEKK